MPSVPRAYLVNHRGSLLREPLCSLQHLLGADGTSACQMSQKVHFGEGGITRYSSHVKTRLAEPC